MPTVNASPIGVKPQFMLASGLPAVGYKLFFYVAGSTSTKQNTYTDSTGTVANTNPVVMNTLGEPTTQIWLTAGQSYKAVLAPATDTDPPTSPVWTIDNLRGINDTSVTIDQWVSGPAPTYIGATQFSLAGDQTSTFQVGRRIRATVTAGTVYGYISVSAYAAVTTVTVVLDSGTLDSGLSAVSYGLISPLGSSLATAAFRYTGTSSGNVAVLDANGKMPYSTLDPDYMQLFGAAGGGALQLTLPAGEYLEFIGSGTRQQFVTTATLTVTIPSGGTLGVPTTTTGRLWVVAMWNGGSPELAVINTWDGTNIYEILPTDSISTTAVSAGSTSAQVWYSTTSRSTQSIAIVGYIESVNTAGAWASPGVGIGFGPGIPLPGQVIQTRRKTFAGSTTSYGSTTTPVDNSIPQSGEGNAITDLDLAITPRSALNLLRAEYLIALANGSATQVVYAVHRDSVADAVWAESELLAASTTYLRKIEAEFIAGATSPTTTKLRIGGNAASAIRLGVDTTFATVLFGTANKSAVRVQEIQR